MPPALRASTRAEDLTDEAGEEHASVTARRARVPHVGQSW